MSPYSIQCSTCHVRLKVRKAHAIGEIVNCPKCGAMVMISPPPPPDHPDQDAASAERKRTSMSKSQALCEESFDQIAQILDMPPCDDERQELMVDEANQSSAPLESEDHVQDGEVARESTDTASAAPSTSSRPWLLTAVGIVGAMTAVAVFQTLAGGQADDVSAMAVAPAGAIEAVLKNASQTAGGTKRIPTAVPPQLAPASLLTATSATSLGNEIPEPTRTASSQQNFRNAGTLASLPTASQEALREPASTPDQTLPSAESKPRSAAGVVVSVQPTRRVPSRAGLRERLREPLEIKINQQPFLRFVADMERLANAPITVDPVGLVNERTRVAQGISFEAGPMPLGHTIQAALRSTGLMIGLQDGNLVIHQRETPWPDDDARFAKHDVSDLIREAPAGNLVAMIQAFVRPQAWQSGGGTAQVALTRNVLVIDGASTAMHREVRHFCEQLRTFRGLPRISNGSASEMQPAWARADAKFSQPCTLHIAQAVRLDEALVRIGEESGAYLLANWQELAEAGIDPADRVKLVADGESLAGIVAAICHRMGAEHRIVAQDVCEITSREAASQAWETVFHRVEDLVENRTRGQGSIPQELIASIYNKVGSEWFAPNRGAIEFDAASQCLIVRLPQTQQRAVDGLLRSLRA